MQIDTTEKFIEALENAITEIGRENGKVLAGQIKALVEQTKTGDTEKTILVWEYEDTPYAIRNLVDAAYPKKSDKIIYVVLYPIGYKGNTLSLIDRYGHHNEVYPHSVKLPLQTLHAYF